jgi:hypothetical protein
MNGSLRILLDSSTVTSRQALAKFLASLLKKLQKSHLWKKPPDCHAERSVAAL